jgi:hypothetical protein
VAAKIARPDDPMIPAGALRRFTVNMLDPPSTARDLEVRFDSGGGGRPVHAVAVAAEPPAAAPPAAPAPIEAVPAVPAAPALSPAAGTEHG